MATVIPLKSLITFLIFAWVIISWPFRMPPRSSPMMTSTIAISTKVKPFSVDVLRLKSDAFIWTPLLMERLEVLAQQVLIHSGFHIGRNVRSRERGRICRALQLRADLAARWFAVVHLPVDGTRDFFRQIREADDPVAVTVRRSLGRPARAGVLVVAGYGAVTVLVGGHCHSDAVEIVNDVLDLGLGDHFLALQDAAQEQPDDHEHDRDFHQGEAGLGRNLAVDIGRTHATPETIPELKIRQKPARYVPDSMPVQPPFRAGDTALFVEKWTLTTT